MSQCVLLKLIYRINNQVIRHYINQSEPLNILKPGDKRFWWFGLKSNRFFANFKGDWPSLL